MNVSSERANIGFMQVVKRGISVCACTRAARRNAGLRKRCLCCGVGRRHLSRVTGRRGYVGVTVRSFLISSESDRVIHCI